MKKKLIAIVLIVMFVMTGCNYSQTGIEGLLQPPKLSQQQNEIYNALVKNKEKTIKLKYPRKGEFTSAFLINNIDEEPTDEAIVFYEKTDNSAPNMPLRIEVFDQVNGKWVSTNEVGVEASEVEKVSFEKIDEKIYIVIGFNQIKKSEKLVKIYSFENGTKLIETNILRCNNYEVFDINGDGTKEVVTIETKDKESEVKTVTANVYEMVSSGIKPIGHEFMDPNVDEYVEIHQGRLLGGAPALYLDCLKGTTNLSTEILTMRDNKLVNLIYNPNKKYDQVPNTLRQYGAVSVDLNKDGVYEIPQLRTALGYETQEPHLQLNFTEWYNYKGDQLELVKTTYIDYQLGYVFELPEKWIGLVTIDEVISEREVIFYEYNEANPIMNEKLASIKVMKKSEYIAQKKLNEEYSIVKENGQLVYLYRIYDTSSNLAITISDIENCFSLIS